MYSVSYLYIVCGKFEHKQLAMWFTKNNILQKGFKCADMNENPERQEQKLNIDVNCKINAFCDKKNQIIRRIPFVPAICCDV